MPVKPKPKLKPSPNPSPNKDYPKFGIDLAKWRESPDLISASKRLLQNRTYLTMLDVARNMMPFSPQVNEGVSADQTLGRLRGWKECITLLETLPFWETGIAETTEETWGVEEEDDQL